MLVEKCFRRHDEALRAEAALRAAVLRESALQWMQPAVALQAFDRRDLVANGFQSHCQTREPRAAINMHGAAAARAHVAAALGAGEIEVLANGIEQHVIRPDRDFVGRAVNAQGDKVFIRHTKQAFC